MYFLGIIIVFFSIIAVQINHIEIFMDSQVLSENGVNKLIFYRFISIIKNHVVDILVKRSAFIDNYRGVGIIIPFYFGIANAECITPIGNIKGYVIIYRLRYGMLFRFEIK